MFGDDFDPIMRAAEQATRLHAMAMDSDSAQDVKASVDSWLKIGEYVHPKLKAVEISGTEGSDLPAISVTIVRGKDGDSDTGGV